MYISKGTEESFPKAIELPWKLDKNLITGTSISLRGSELAKNLHIVTVNN